jgi:hypothetical protein
MSGSLQGLQNDDLAAAVEYSLVQISFSRLCPSTSNHAKVRHRPPLCHPEELTCLRQSKTEMNWKSRLILLALFFVH